SDPDGRRIRTFLNAHDIKEMNSHKEYRWGFVVFRDIPLLDGKLTLRRDEVLPYKEAPDGTLQIVIEKDGYFTKDLYDEVYRKKPQFPPDIFVDNKIIISIPHDLDDSLSRIDLKRIANYSISESEVNDGVLSKILSGKIFWRNISNDPNLPDIP